MLERNTIESRFDVAEGIKRLSGWIEPGLIDQLFADWVDEYLGLLDAQENSRSNDQASCLQEDQAALSQ